MIPDLLWIIGFYVAAAVWAHWAYRQSAGASRRHYVLVAGNHQLHIEGYVRALRRFSRRSGTDIGITVVLDRSTDETGAIVERFSRGNAGIELVRHEDERAIANRDRWECSRAGDGGNVSEQVVWVELGREEHAAKLPPWRRL
ncbi:hypothetical protein [Cohnella panacarvi]|uniref:hypothetical protein n=1 Tax=Cohnella panacarvi TaxID=400776 RepID=UPI00047EBF30|nr:hypothetical protein [Cohnella panacarvi]